MRAIAAIVIALLSFSSFSSVQAEPSNSCKQCRDQQQACAKNYGSKACKTDYDLCRSCKK